MTKIPSTQLKTPPCACSSKSTTTTKTNKKSMRKNFFLMEANTDAVEKRTNLKWITKPLLKVLILPPREQVKWGICNDSKTILLIIIIWLGFCLTLRAVITLNNLDGLFPEKHAGKDCVLAIKHKANMLQFDQIWHSGIDLHELSSIHNFCELSISKCNLRATIN